jgi:hypothetical protein
LSLAELAVRDFQSIVEANLELGPLTVIVGVGNSGKTAAVRALKALALNRTGSDFIRHGQSECVVAVVTDDGRVIGWVKDRTTAKYALDDQELVKLAGAVPEDVSDALGIRRIEVEQGLSVMPQVHGQFDPPFLLDESPGKAARIIAKLTRLDVIVSAQIAVSRDLKRATAQLKGDRAALETAVEEHTHLAQGAKIAQTSAEQTGRLYDEAVELESGLSAAEKATVLLQQARKTAKRVLPAAGDLAELDDLLQRCEAAHAAVQRWDALDRVLGNVCADLGDTSQLLETVATALGAFKTCPLCGAQLPEDKCGG